ncbi:MAG: amidohydrolase [Syntrophus sp. (in: bacteria)]|nr:amidohydrolase [Syntrophus sp. (in: bacteria)]
MIVIKVIYHQNKKKSMFWLCHGLYYSMEIIDAHTHIFPSEIIKRRERIAAKDEGFAKIYGNPQAPMVNHEVLLNYMEREGVMSSVVCGFPFRDTGFIRLVNDYILETAAHYRTLIPLASVSIAENNCGIGEAERCLRAGARGIGEVAFYDEGLGSRELERLHEIGGLAKRFGIPLLLHMNEQVGHHYRGKMAIDFKAVSRFVESHGDLSIILAHCGGGLCFYEFMPEIRRVFARVFYDTAALPYIYSHDMYKFIEMFLSEKTLFGSDYPLLSLKRYEEGMNGLDEKVREKVLGGNALKVFGHG